MYKRNLKHPHYVWTSAAFCLTLLSLSGPELPSQPKRWRCTSARPVGAPPGLTLRGSATPFTRSALEMLIPDARLTFNLLSRRPSAVLWIVVKRTWSQIELINYRKGREKGTVTYQAPVTFLARRSVLSGLILAATPWVGSMAEKTRNCQQWELCLWPRGEEVVMGKLKTWGPGGEEMVVLQFFSGLTKEN